jgi:hypothetical protein
MAFFPDGVLKYRKKENLGCVECKKRPEKGLRKTPPTRKCQWLARKATPTVNAILNLSIPTGIPLIRLTKVGLRVNSFCWISIILVESDL